MTLTDRHIIASVDDALLIKKILNERGVDHHLVKIINFMNGEKKYALVYDQSKEEVVDEVLDAVFT